MSNDTENCHKATIELPIDQSKAIKQLECPKDHIKKLVVIGETADGCILVEIQCVPAIA